MKVPQKIKNRTAMWPSNPISRYFSKENKNTSFIAALFTIAKILKQSKYTSISPVQISHSVVSILCDSMNRSTPGLPVHHQLPESTKTHVRSVGDAMEQSHPLFSLSTPALNLSQYQRLSNESALHIRWPKYWSFTYSLNEYSYSYSILVEYTK